MRSLKSLQDAANRAAPAAAASYTFIGAVVLLGGLGYAGDRSWGTSPWLLLAGIVLGFIVGFYELVMLTRPVSRDEPSDGPDDSPPSSNPAGRRHDR